jgi:hypothetical protein
MVLLVCHSHCAINFTSSHSTQFASARKTKLSLNAVSLVCVCVCVCVCVLSYVGYQDSALRDCILFTHFH